ncbi:MAG: hypothetical protein EBT47_08405 [Chloroflexi bacterium]|nr:hypothetical protein [Chloroflexota bacterium]
MSAIDIMVALYKGGILNLNPSHPSAPDRDRFILSKGHAAPALYAVLAEHGVISHESLDTLRVIGSPLEGHPNMRRLAGVEASTGSLGQGLSIGLGHAFAGRLDGHGYRTYVMCGDGEMQEGQVWEAIMAAAHFNADNLTLIVDHNGAQQSNLLPRVIDYRPLAAKLRAFEWHVEEIDGHDMPAILRAFDSVFPDRFFNVGIAESNMVGVAAGLAASGKIPVVSSFAAFLLCNAYDQLRMSVAFPHLNVKVVGTHAGISIGEDGPSQMAIEDFALACSLPGFTVIVPSDEAHTHAAVRAMIAHEGPVYLRLGRPKAPRIHEAGSSLEIGKAYQLRDGSDLTIVACGLMTAAALEAHDALAAKGIHARVLDFPTIRPLDVEHMASLHPT